LISIDGQIYLVGVPSGKETKCIETLSAAKMAWVNSTCICILTTAGELYRWDVTENASQPRQVFSVSYLEPEKIQLDMRCGVTPDEKWWIIHNRWIRPADQGEHQLFSGNIECYDSTTQSKRNFSGSAYTITNLPNLYAHGSLIVVIDSVAGSTASVRLLLDMHASLRLTLSVSPLN
jgi:hypothetical protein